MTITHDALDLTIQGLPLYMYPPPKYRDTPLKDIDMFKLGPHCTGKAMWHVQTCSL